ncbi:MAG: riboflavin biosynthesis protein RibF [Propionibacteriaceae bacterium]|jgi:riboflavin kinase/FMN adenylyltransferase|nr:riboflavin biosynthesis protein RibF [Propionibacteriaceae bacterium]
MSRVIAIGNFDGVHRGHQSILQQARQLAGTGRVVALSFWPHPLAILDPNRAPDLLCGISQRVSLLRKAGADEVSIVEFTPELASWTPAQFVERVIIPQQAEAIVVGENFRFGAAASADGNQMRELAHGRFEVNVLPMLGGTQPVSSSRIRAAIAAGDPASAAQMLGRWFRFTGIVQLGDQRGHALGFPTANLAVPAKRACPADGVYAGWLHCGSDTWPTAISVGTNPTFDGVRRRVEAHAIDQVDLNLYGELVKVDFVAHLRGQMRFDSIEALIAQMGADVAASRQVLGATTGLS